jgi:hypothetical protein
VGAGVLEAVVVDREDVGEDIKGGVSAAQAGVGQAEVEVGD